jgi:hypothetical protein
MFLAKFNKVDNKGNKFPADKNASLPYIGTLFAGKSTGTLINGTIFEREGYSTERIYACTNVERPYTNEDGDTIMVTDTVIMQPVSTLELPELMKQLGAPVLLVDKPEEEVEAKIEGKAVKVGA